MGNSCKSADIPTEVLAVVERVFTDDMMPLVANYMANGMIDFKKQIESDYFSTVVMFEDNRMVIKVHNAININQLRNIQIKNDTESVSLTTDTMKFESNILDLSSNESL